MVEGLTAYPSILFSIGLIVIAARVSSINITRSCRHARACFTHVARFTPTTPLRKAKSPGMVYKLFKLTIVKVNEFNSM